MPLINTKTDVADLLVFKYEDLFKDIFPRNKWYAPQVMCLTCRRSIDGSKGGVMLFAVPTKWLQREEHNEETCYFCFNLQRPRGYKYKQRHSIQYFESAYVIRPEFYSAANVSESVNSDNENNLDDKLIECDSRNDKSDVNYESNKSSSSLVTPKEVDNFVRDLNMAKRDREYFTSWLVQRELTTNDNRITANRKRKKFACFDECFVMYRKFKTFCETNFFKKKIFLRKSLKSI